MLIDPSLRAADRVVVIGETMKKRVEAKGVSPERVRVIPNWGDAASVVPKPHDNEWARSHKLAKSFVVMHSGNIGHAQNLDALIRATTFLRDLDDLAVVLIGSGARRGELVALARTLEADKVEILAYQERAILSESLSTADIHVVGLVRGLAGYVVPSRVYGILAAGRPVIAATDAESETAQLVAEVGCGSSCRRGTRSRSRRRSGPRTTASTTSRRWGGAHGRSPSPSPTGRSRCGATASARRAQGAGARR